MPLYAFECTACGARFDRIKSLSDASAPECPNGHRATRRVYSPPTVIFKGAGFYSTDNRRGKKPEA